MSSYDDVLMLDSLSLTTFEPFSFYSHIIHIVLAFPSSFDSPSMPWNPFTVSIPSFRFLSKSLFWSWYVSQEILLLCVFIVCFIYIWCILALAWLLMSLLDLKKKLTHQSIKQVRQFVGKWSSTKTIIHTIINNGEIKHLLRYRPFQLESFPPLKHITSDFCIKLWNLKEKVLTVSY